MDSLTKLSRSMCADALASNYFFNFTDKLHQEGNLIPEARLSNLPVLPSRGRCLLTLVISPLDIALRVVVFVLTFFATLGGALCNRGHLFQVTTNLLSSFAVIPTAIGGIIHKKIGDKMFKGIIEMHVAFSASWSRHIKEARRCEIALKFFAHAKHCIIPNEHHIHVNTTSIDRLLETMLSPPPAGGGGGDAPVVPQGNANGGAPVAPQRNADVGRPARVLNAQERVDAQRLANQRQNEALAAVVQNLNPGVVVRWGIDHVGVVIQGDNNPPAVAQGGNNPPAVAQGGNNRRRRANQNNDDLERALAASLQQQQADGARRVEGQVGRMRTHKELLTEALREFKEVMDRSVTQAQWAEFFDPMMGAESLQAVIGIFFAYVATHSEVLLSPNEEAVFGGEWTLLQIQQYLFATRGLGDLAPEAREEELQIIRMKAYTFIWHNVNPPKNPDPAQNQPSPTVVDLDEADEHIKALVISRPGEIAGIQGDTAVSTYKFLSDVYNDLSRQPQPVSTV